ncbi:Uncharacterized protein LHYA1_G001261 [Lachnellula hyalina]|uniref:Fibronectin type-III domain-containing protein n=1 Tax=Lachnellula hyalina TaxID=1316788 RepID=A0A8H8U355_9HELO|nr:Uncharacterized protein LHYA1_G001261 [Lachnellula hyalina]TVY29951.1 Uncharacterized protein LHYA1_G001261 [Lachnellula hyalina]
MNALTYYSELADRVLNHVTDSNMFYVQSVVTCTALVWLLHRAWLTLWKPVPELISILGVEVPDAPAVSLAGIKAEAVTLHWTRPGVNKPVLKYLIQVNGVNVGESSRMETAITVTGLKPGHFYNVRVIAVGSNNFQAGSRVIRLRTYGRDGRPLVSGRVPSNFSIEDQDSGDELPSIRTQGAGVEMAALNEGAPALQRDSSYPQSGQRRNTGGRKHSPSSAAADQAASDKVSSKHPESIHQLTEKFEGIRGDTEEIMGQITRDAEDFKCQMDDLRKERDEKKQMLKEKEEASEKLKREVNSSERANRQAQNRKSQKEKLLRDKVAERAKMQEDIARWEQEIETMKAQRETYLQEKEDHLEAKGTEAEELRETIREHHGSISGLEEEIRVKGLQLKQLEEERKHLPGGEDSEESRARDAADKQRDVEWEIKQRNLTEQLTNRAVQLRQLEYQQQELQNTISALSIRQASNPLMYHGNSSGVDFESMAGQNKPKPRRSRKGKSRTNTVSSPVASYPITDSPFPSVSSYNNLNATSSTFAQGPYFDLTPMVPLSDHFGMSEADVKALTAGAPLSPTATSLLPSNIFDIDDDPPSPRAGSTRSFGGALYSNAGQAVFGHDPQSPSSSSRSASLISSPQASSQNLAMYGVSGHDYAIDSDRRSLHSPRAEFGAIGSPSASSSRLTSNKALSSLFQFSKARGKTIPQDGPPLGSLKQGQSQSLPRSADEPETEAVRRRRRTSLSSSWNVPNIFNRSQAVSEATEGNGPAPARNPTNRSRRRAFGMFGSGSDDPSLFADRDLSSPRPVSIASSDLPRPSTDSAPFGWAAAEGTSMHKNSPLATNWSVNVVQPWSSNPSRRPSIHQSSSTTALTSGIASEDDEFLPSDTLAGQSSPPPVGVIGTRPVSSYKQVTPKLNPAAPTFKAMFPLFNSKTDKGKDGGKGKEKVIENPLFSGDGSRSINATSPSEPRQSRDTPSIRTQNSMAESHDSLEITLSNTTSELTNPSTKDKESSFRQLLRKGSSSKFSLSSIRGKDSGLFGGGKKGGSSVATSERDGSLDGFGEDGQGGKNTESVTSSPMLGSGDWKGKEKDNHPGTPKEGRMSNWTRPFKRGRARESSDVERSEAEMTGTEDEYV